MNKVRGLQNANYISDTIISEFLTTQWKREGIPYNVRTRSIITYTSITFEKEAWFASQHFDFDSGVGNELWRAINESDISNNLFIFVY